MASGMIIGGASIIGWMAVEFLGGLLRVFARRVGKTAEIPIGMNILGALGCGLIAGGIVLS